MVDKLREVFERVQQQPEEKQNDSSEMAQRESDWSQQMGWEPGPSDA